MADAPAVFDATFSDWRLVKGRKVVQIVLEVPLETAGLAYQVLGGMPDPGKSVWCAVARLKGGDASVSGNGLSGQLDTPPHSHSETVNKPGNAGGAKRKWGDIPLAQQAGILGADDSFCQYLDERTKDLFVDYPVGERSTMQIRYLCGVTSRAEIIPHTPAGDRWRNLVADFRVWDHVLA